MKITKRQLRRIIKEAMHARKGEPTHVTFVFNSPVEKNLAMRALNKAMLPADFGVQEMMVHVDDVQDVEEELRYARVRYAKR
jgi:hypothetical protein